MVWWDDVVVLLDCFEYSRSMFAAYWCPSLVPPLMAFTPVIHCYKMVLSQLLPHRNHVTDKPWHCTVSYARYLRSNKTRPIKFDRAGMSFTCCSDYRGLRCTAAFPFTMRPKCLHLRYIYSNYTIFRISSCQIRHYENIIEMIQCNVLEPGWYHSIFDLHRKF